MKVKGQAIVFMTDAMLINEAQRDPLLRHVSCLIIDEAHERSLYTDVVVGIAKLVHSQRPDNFFIVISSATIEPSGFLSFFRITWPDGKQTIPGHLEAPGRVFKVDVEYRPPLIEIGNFKTNLEEFIIPTILKTLYFRTEGNALVFLYGKQEIDQAIKEFVHQLKKDYPDMVDEYEPLPLHGQLQPEEQVIYFT
jgi:ATP-dependent RNA helicase DDX35